MDTLSIIGNICSIAGLIIAVFVASQVISIKNIIKDSSISIVKQKDNKTEGDIAGRDIHK